MLPFKPVFVILSCTIIQIVARFHTSRLAYRSLFGSRFAADPWNELYEYCFWLIGDFLLQFPLLLLLIRFVLKEGPSRYSVQRGDGRLGLKAALAFWAIMVPILWFVSADAAFQQVHPAPHAAKLHWVPFLIYAVCSALYLVGWEFIWRGYVLFGLKEHFGHFAVLIQAVPFALLHLGSPEIETFAAVAAGIGLGMLALATRSFWYGALAHMLVLGTMDLMGALRFRAGSGRSLLELVSKGF